MATYALVEHDNSAISYGGPWTPVTRGDFNFDLSGNSAHFLPANIVDSTTAPATLTFNFTGREIGVYGVASLFNNSIPDSADMPVWECAVDGNLLQSNNPYGKYPLESYCETTDLEGDISHEFQLTVTHSGAGLYIDFLRYLVGANQFSVVPPNTTAWIAPSDPRLGGQGWLPLGGGFRTTQEAPTKEMPVLSVTFSGSSLTWYGLTKAAIGIADPALPALTTNDTISTEGFYTIDDASESHDFSASVPQDIAQANSNPYNVILFSTPPMDVGTHTLNVYYDVNSTVWPLTLDSLAITNGFSISPFLPPSSPTHRSKGAIIGGAVGGVVGGLVVILLVLLVRRQGLIKRREERRRNMVEGIERNDIKLRPFGRLEDGHVEDPVESVEAIKGH